MNEWSRVKRIHINRISSPCVFYAWELWEDIIVLPGNQGICDTEEITVTSKLLDVQYVESVFPQN